VKTIAVDYYSEHHASFATAGSLFLPNRQLACVSNMRAGGKNGGFKMVHHRFTCGTRRTKVKT
jgi:hypothetical protein